MPDSHGWPTKSERDLDALVAEKVMGLDVKRDGVTRDLRIDHVIRGTNRRIPHYTTDIAAAWLVVEHITRPPTTIEEAWRMTASQFALWFDQANLWACSAQEAAEMICKQALLCVGVNIEV